MAAIDTAKQKSIDADYAKYIGAGMPSDVAVFAANERYELWRKAPAMGLKFVKYWAAFTETFLYPYGLDKPNGIAKLAANVFLTALSVVPVVGGIAAGVTVKIMQAGNQPVSYGNLPAICTEFYLPTVLQNSAQASTGVTSAGVNIPVNGQGVANHVNQSNLTMLDLLKKWLFVIISVVVGVAGIVYYTSAKSTTDKKKRKLFLYVGIAAVAVGGFLGYKKLTAK